MNSPKARILSFGSFQPSKRVTNDDLSRIVDTSDEWIYTRSGIRSRAFCPEGVNLSDMAVASSIAALEKANLKASDLDYIILCTITPDTQLNAAACVVQRKLGAFGSAALDIRGACAGFIYGLDIARAFVESGRDLNALVIGSEKMSSIINWEDRTTCVLFGDGAGCAVVSSNQDASDHYVIDSHVCADSANMDILQQPAGGSNVPPDHKDFNYADSKVQMVGREVFKFAIKRMSESLSLLCERNNLKFADLDKIIFHQANARIIEALQKKFDLRDDQLILDIENSGNTSAASIPLAFDKMERKGVIKPGQTIGFAAMGAGLSYGSALVHW